MQLPNENVHTQFKSLQQQLKDLSNLNPRPNNFFSQAMLLQNGINDVLPSMQQMFMHLRGATDTYNECIIVMRHCTKINDCNLGYQFERLHNCLVSIGMKSCIDNL